jgi:AcrR family transcriptional regulator
MTKTAASRPRPTARARAKPRRDGAETRERILRAALTEFSKHGFSGGRIDRISRAARVNVRMIYHYFSSKGALYLEAIETSYRSIRDRERTLILEDTDPVTAMRRLVSVTFDFLADDPHFVRLIMNENLMMGKMVRKSKVIPTMTRPLLEALDSILHRGQAEELFHKDIDAESLYISVLGLCFIHVSNRYTLGNMFGRDYSDRGWLTRRKGIVTDIVLSYLTGQPRE